jgi:ribosomal-protein-alanine N-acetyltransferase
VSDILTTERLALHPLAVDDVERLWPHVSNPELPRFMTWDAHTSRDTTRDFLTYMVEERASREGYGFTIRLHDDTFVGVIGLHGVTRQRLAWRMDCAELGYWCAPPMQNKGYVSEAVRETLRFAFLDLGLHRVTVGCITDNAPSLRVIEKHGFRSIGISREHMFRFGRWWDHASFEMLESEWRTANSGRARHPSSSAPR